MARAWPDATRRPCGGPAVVRVSTGECGDFPWARSILLGFRLGDFGVNWVPGRVWSPKTRHLLEVVGVPFRYVDWAVWVVL